MDNPEMNGEGLGLGSNRPYRFVTRLMWVYGVFTVVTVALLLSLVLPFTALQIVRNQAMEAVAGGAGGLVLSTLLMVLTVLAATQAMTAARARYRVATEDETFSPQARFSLGSQFGPGAVARQGQAAIIVTGAVLTCFASSKLWPMTPVTPLAFASPNILGAVAIAFAFGSLICERMIAAYPAVQMPEAVGLRRALLAATVMLALAGALEIGRGAGLLWLYWGIAAVSIVPWAVSVELGLRALARLFLPPPRAAEAHALADSIVLGLVTGGPRAPGALIRTHLGIDFTRSWALTYLMTALPPAIVATALLCWGLSGLKLIDMSERGIYERFGAPVAVLGPGIHLLLPWPIGVLRPVELGTLHEIKVATNAGETEAKIPAEAIPPTSTNHLWDTAVPTEAEYLVASQNQAGAEGFQAVDAEIHVVYRTGLTDADAMQSVYGTATPPADLVSEAAGRVVSEYFASHTLEQVMGAAREQLADTLRATLARDIAAYHAGIEIVSVHIESVHPPAGAAAAYHGVQAAEINANASIFQETARAKRQAGVADEEAHQIVTASQALAEETVHSANADAYKFDADRKAYGEGKDSFLLERQFSALDAALSQVRLTVVDNRLTPAQAPIIDMRGGAGAIPGVTANPATPAPAAATPAIPNLTPGVENAN